MIGNMDVLFPSINNILMMSSLASHLKFSDLQQLSFWMSGWHDGRYKPVTCAKKVTLLKQYEDCPTWHLREEGSGWWRSGTAYGDTTASIVAYYLCTWQALYMASSHVEGFYSFLICFRNTAKATPVQAFVAVEELSNWSTKQPLPQHWLLQGQPWPTGSLSIPCYSSVPSRFITKELVWEEANSWCGHIAVVVGIVMSYSASKRFSILEFLGFI